MLSYTDMKTEKRVLKDLVYVAVLLKEQVIIVFCEMLRVCFQLIMAP